MPPDFMKKVVVPLLLTGAVIFAITTVDDKENYINGLIDQIISGKLKFIQWIQHSLACDDCRDLGIANKCDHVVIEAPRWNDPTKLKKVEQLMGDSGSFYREAMGLMSGQLSEKAFPDKEITKFRMADKVDIVKTEISHIYVSIDPAAGGHASKYSIITTTRYKGQIVVISIDEIRSKNPLDVDNMVVSHIKRVKNFTVYDKKPFYKAKIVFIVESNLGYEHHRIAGVIKSSGLDIITVNEEDGKLGIFTDPWGKLKGKMVASFTIKIKHDEIRLYTYFLTQSKKTETELYSPEEMMDELCKQLRDYEKRFRFRTDPEKPPITIFTGKGANTRDDLVMAILLNVEGADRFVPKKGKFY